MQLRQQILQDRVEALASHLQIDEDAAFLRLAHSLITGKSVHLFDEGDLVEGSQDKQIDTITIDEDGEGADVYIIQAKNTTSFSSNALIQLRNGLDWLFRRSRKELSSLENQALRDKITEYRATQTNLGPANIRVHVRYVTNGSTAHLSTEFVQELESTRSLWDNDTFESFDIDAVGFDELSELSKAQERQTRKVDADLKIKADASTPSLIKYYAQGLKGLVCSIPGSEIARLCNDNPDGAIFDLNIRRFLGGRRGVNRDIAKTATDTGLSFEFWFLNNGITIVCDNFDVVTDPDDPHVKLKNLQIVNGCQTATTLAHAQAEGDLAPDVRVITRVYETEDPDLVSKIVLTTNNQNQIRSRDLRSNDPVQIDMEKGFRIYGYFYERKPRQFEAEDCDAKLIFTNEAVGQWYLGIVLRSPSDARARKYKVWGDFHSKIFGGGPIEPYLIAALLGRRVGEWLKNSDYAKSEDEVVRILAKRGAFHTGRIAAFLWRGNDEWKLPQDDLKKQLQEVQSSNELEKHFDKAFEILVDIVKNSDTYSVDVDGAVKAVGLDKDIDTCLYKMS